MEKVKVKIIGVSCNHRSARNTAWLILYALKAAEKFGKRISEVADIETEFIELGDKKKKFVSAASCKKVNGHYECSTHDYIYDEVFPKMAAADGYILGSPVFTGSYTSNYITLIERLRAGVKDGCFTGKPMGGVSVATMPTGGQDRCLESMEISTRALGMIPIHALFGCAGISGVPYGPLPGDDDGTVIAVKKDRFSQWSAILTGRRVAEAAVIKKVAEQFLGNLYKNEFIQKYQLPFSSENWGWTKLDPEGEEYMKSLNDDKLKKLDGKIISNFGKIQNKGIKCKILGLGCDDYAGANTNWLVVNSLKAIEKFGRRLEPVATFETEFIDLSDKNIRRCLNCDHYNDMPNGGRPWKGGKPPSPDSYGCIIKNDYFAEEIAPRYAEASGVIYGSSVCSLSPSITFRLIAERLVAGIWFGWNNLKATANIAVSYDDEGGLESCLNTMNTCNRWKECIPVSWPHGTPARVGSIDPSKIVVMDDAMACALSVINARRVAEFALMTSLAKQELGDIYKKEFYQVVHPPHGDDAWEWSRLDKEDDEYMMNLTPKSLAEVSS